MVSLNRQNWFRTGWRPAMAWQYFAVNLFDFILFPMMSAVFYAYLDRPIPAWRPLTLQGGGLYHISMGAILGVAVWTRSKELTCPPPNDRQDGGDDDSGGQPETPHRRSSRAD